MTTVPPILRITLPFLSADPDGLFDQLAERVPHFPLQPILQHHKMMLNLMTNLTVRRRWVERSGASSVVASPLLCAFPEAKIVYLTRNVADTARSIAGTRLSSWARSGNGSGCGGADPWTLGGQNALPDAAEVPEEMRRLMPDRITREALTDVMTRDIRRFEALAAHMHGSAEQALADMKPRHLHRLRYEDLVARPFDELTELGEFLGFADPSRWAARTAGPGQPLAAYPFRSASVKRQQAKGQPALARSGFPEPGAAPHGTGSRAADRGCVPCESARGGFS